MRLALFILSAALGGSAAVAQTPPVTTAPAAPPTTAPATPPAVPGVVPKAAAPAPAALDPANNRLDAILMQWEAKMKTYNAVGAEVTRTDKSKQTGFTDIHTGTAKLLRPGYAALHLTKQGAQDRYEWFICTGTELHEYIARDKVVRIRPLPAGFLEQPDDNFLAFLFGPKATTVKQRYDIKLVKEDQWYVYLEMVPKNNDDRVDFVRGRIVLSIQTYLPRQLWFEQPNADEVIWDFPRMDPTIRLDRAQFVAPVVPAGWTVTKLPPPATPAPAPTNAPAPGTPTSNPPPTTVRPQGQ
jgi:TIGR03009 family protein